MFSLANLPNQQANEHAIRLYRRHWFTLFLILLFYLALAIFPAVIVTLMWSEVVEPALGDIGYPLFVLMSSAYYLAMITFVFHEFVDWYLDVWVVTNERIIALEQKGLFSRVVSEQKLSRVQDVTSEIHGFFPTVLKYGDVFIQTAGQQQRFIFRQVPDPDGIVKLLHEVSETCKLEHHHGDEGGV